MANVICVPKSSYTRARNVFTELPGIATLGWRGFIRSYIWVLRSRRGAKGLVP